MEPIQEKPIKSFVVPAPTRGLNYKQALPFMDPDTAISMSNLIPNGATVDVRGALEKWATVGSATELRGLWAYKASDGGEYLIGYGQYDIAGNPQDIFYDLTSGTATAIKQVAAWSGFVTNYPDPAPVAVNFGGYLFIATGAFSNFGSLFPTLIRVGPPSGANRTFQAADVTANLGHAMNAEADHIWGTIGVYKNRIYAALGPSINDGSITQKIFYGNVNQVASTFPTTNVYDVSFLTKQGGKIIYADSVTRQEGAFSQSLFAVVTEMGEMLVFQGDYPGSTTWALVGYYVIPRPLGKRAFFYIGSSLYIITQSGIFSFAELTSNYGSDNKLAFESDYINNNFPTYATYGLTLNSLTQGIQSWYGTYFPKENKVYIGYPESASTYGQLCQDLTTKGWGQLNYRNQVAGTTVFNNGLYGFAPASYTYQLQGSTHIDDYFNGSTWTHSPISISAQLAANYNQDFSTTKQFGDIKALVQCTSPYSVTAGLTVDFDLRSAGYNNYSKTSGGTYGLYQPRFSSGDRENVGKCCIINIGGQFTGADLPMKFVGFEVYYTEANNWG